MKSKTDLRIYAKELRKSLDIQLLSENFINEIRQLDIYIKAKNVMIFYPKKYEIDLRNLLSDDKNFFLPKVSGQNLLVCPYTENMEKSKYNIMEPCSEPVDCEILDLIIVPALMADKQGFRLGYGGGFYDRFLKKCDAKTISLVAKQLYIDKLPVDEYDVKIDKIIVK